MTAWLRSRRHRDRYDEVGAISAAAPLNPRSGRYGVRFAAVAGLLVLAAAASGLVTRVVFHQYSTLKYGLTVAGALIVLTILLTRRPSLVAVAILAIVAPFTPYVMTIHAQPVSVLLPATILAVIVVGLEGVVSTDVRPRSSALSRAIPWILVLLAIPAVLSPNPQTEITYLLTPVAIGWITCRVARLYPDGKDVVIWALLASAGVQAALALVQHTTGRGTDLYGSASATYSANYFYNYGSVARTTGAFFDPISLGNVLALAIPFAVLMVIRRDQGSGRRTIALLLCILLGGGLAVTLSRESWIAAAVGCVAVAVCSPPGQRRRGIQFVGALLLGTAVLSVALYGPTVRARFDSIEHPTAKNSTGDTNAEREAIWSLALHAFETHPVTGVGLGQYTNYLSSSSAATSPAGDEQSVYLQYLAEAGVLGGAALCLLIGGVAVDLKRSARSNPVRPALIGSALAIAVCWVTDVTIDYMAVEACTAIVLGLVVASGSAAGSALPGSAAAGSMAPGSDSPGTEGRVLTSQLS